MSSILGTFPAKVASIRVEAGTNNAKRFILTALILATADQPHRYEYFSTPMSSPDSVRINAQQLRNAFVELMGVTSDAGVYTELLTKRSKFINRDIHITITEQLDRETKLPKKNDKGVTYTNVRIEPSSDDMSEEAALSLLGAVGTGDTTGTEAGPVDDIPM